MQTIRRAISLWHLPEAYVIVTALRTSQKRIGVVVRVLDAAHYHWIAVFTKFRLFKFCNYMSRDPAVERFIFEQENVNKF